MTDSAVINIASLQFEEQIFGIFALNPVMVMQTFNFTNMTVGSGTVCLLQHGTIVPLLVHVGQRGCI